MPLTTIGPRGYHHEQAVATSSFTPQNDRAAIVRYIQLDKPSASDTWIISVNSRETARFLERTTGHQQLLGGKSADYPKVNDIFHYCRVATGEDLIYPVPLGTTFTISSVGGATADILIEYTEHTSNEVQATLVNHPQSAHLLLPIYAYRNAAVTAVGDNTFDTEVKPAFVPNFFEDENMPTGWNIRLLGLFAEGVGVNTYSGAADHLSNTRYLSLEKDGQRMFTRDNLDGIPVVGAAAAAGSANAVLETTTNGAPPFQEQNVWDWDYFDPPLVVRPGQAWRWRLGIAGDVTGGADYSGAVVVGMLDVVQTGLSQ